MRRPRTLEQLRAALDAPRYQPPPEFETLRQSLVKLSDTDSNWIGLVGPSAAGKTAAARQLIGELQSSHSDVQVLAGKCDEDATLYQPIREALAELGLSAGFASAQSQGGEVNSIFERLADEFIPFWDFFSHGGDEVDEARARNDLLAAVTNALHALLQQTGVILFLDDVQWIDEGSAAVIRHLRENFVPTHTSPFLIILASRSPEALEKLGLKEGIVPLTPPARAEQIVILERSLGIELSAAKQIVGALGVLGQESGGMFWLLRSVRELVSANAFAPSPRGFVLRAPYLKTGRLPVPAAMRAKLRESLQASGEFLPVLECAALIGERFRVDDLAEVLGIDRLKLLRILRQLEREHQLLRDLPADEESYAFSSRYLLEIVREDLEVGKGESASRRRPSKLARELHARIAAVLARRLPRTPRLAMAIAEHFCAAGATYAPQCLEHCLASEQVARKRQRMDEARHFAAMAQRAARLANRVVDIPDEKLQSNPEELRPPPTERSQHLSA